MSIWDSTFWKAIRILALLGAMALLVYFRNHDLPVMGTMADAAWIAVVGVFFTTLAILDLRRHTAWATYSLVSRSEHPGLYWFSTCFHAVFGVGAIVVAAGGALGLWSIH